MHPLRLHINNTVPLALLRHLVSVGKGLHSCRGTYHRLCLASFYADACAGASGWWQPSHDFFKGTCLSTCLNFVLLHPAQ
jgi:hypothetical protein